MQFVGPWELDREALDYWYKQWLEQHKPTQDEINRVDEWLDRALAGPDFVGTQEPPNSGKWYGRVQGTNIVVEYTADASVLRIWISKIAPRA